MNLSPIAEFRPHLGRLLFYFVLGVMAGAIGFGPMLYFGVALLAVGLITILFSQSVKVRASWWGFLCGASLGFASALRYLSTTQQLH